MPAGEYGGRPAQRWVAGVLAIHGDVCHLCHHPGADSADHIKPRLTHPELMYELSNGRPVHHKPCPVCSATCNITRKAKPMREPEPVNSLAFFERRWGVR